MANSADKVQNPVGSLKIRIRRPASMAVGATSAPSPAPPGVKISPAKRKRGRPGKTETSLTPGPVSMPAIAPAKRFRPIKLLPASAPPQPPVATAKRGRPRKVPSVATSLTFKPEPLSSANEERIRARSEAYWKELRWEPSQEGKKDNIGATAASQMDSVFAEPLPATTPATRNKRLRTTKESVKSHYRGEQPSAADKEPASTASKVVAFWNSQKAAAAAIKPKVKRAAGRKARA
ncbi:hypothetical protein PtA15_7A796 [Puccinia triticina]|uniref:Uncharacterized protein n=1 Tax=Puccinia triticina TaxID=208348 RepID=A0ABY7CP86_9BASI|nr:uncharacterized protein PtA15_7A796 [Puccinia triticina]WAQ87066.1 hypothetical protein PtA15_7A796 [Puccinia triticina]WAR56920.1 hypothetical protein PtB15_7B773 [Puccinia triticina]